jgi:surface antigen
MLGKMIAGAAMLPVALMMVGGCAQPTPESCRLNHTSTGAAVGALGGAAIGTVIAAAAHSGAGGYVAGALGGALVGGVVGAMAGRAQDKACHDMALRQALDQAYARNQEREAAAAATASSRQRAASAKASATEYQSVAWANQMTNRTGSITPLSTVPDTAKDQVCMTFADQQIVDGTAQTVTGKACRADNGEWKPVS